MESRRFGSEIVLRVDDGDELLQAVESACRKHGVTSARVSGIGALSSVRLRVLNAENNGFIFRDFAEPMEITSITGNITADGDGLFLHLHLNAADGEMRIHGGHVMSCVIANTAEIWITELSDEILRRSETAEGLLRKIEFDT